MMVLVDVGEVGIHAGERAHILRPSLYAMSQLGSPKEIVEIFFNIMGATPSLVAAAEVLCVCTEEDIDYLTGHGFINGEDMRQWSAGAMSPNDIVQIARCLLKHGLVGVVEEPKRRKPDADENYTEEFRPKEQVAIAMAHLGLTEREAWRMTMTGLVGALRAKYPPEQTSADRAPSAEELEATMDWADRVDAARMKKSGVH